MRDAVTTIGKLTDRQSVVFISSVDEDGFPNTKAMLAPRKREGIKVFYFHTNTSSMRVRQYKSNPQACIYFCDKRFYRGAMLTGTMEVLLVSPVRPIRIVFAKMIPYFALSCLNLVSILLLARFVLDVPMSGSVAGIVCLSLLYLALALALGLFISTISDRQVTALVISAMLMLMPLIMLSGMVFPIENMPGVLRLLSCVVPARWYIDAIRKLMIEGLPFAAVLGDFLILSSCSSSLR